MAFSRNLAWKLSSSLGAGGIHFLFSLVVMRYLGPLDYGRYTFAMGWAGLFCHVVDFGFNAVVVRDVPPQPAIGQGYFRHVVKGKLALMTFSGALMLAVFFFHPRAGELWLPTLLAFLFLVAGSFVETGQAFTAAYEKFKAGAMLIFVNKGLIVLFGVMVFLYHGGLVSLMSMTAVGALLGASATVLFLKRFFENHEVPQQGPASSSTLWKAGFPIFIQMLFTIIYFRIDSVMLSWMKGDQETGIYGAAYRFFDVANVIPGALVAVLVASLSRKIDQGDWEETFWRSLGRFFLAAVGGVVVLQVVSYILTGVFLTDEFQRSEALLRVLSFDLLFLYPNYLLVTTLTLLHRQVMNAWIAAGCVVFNVSANLFAIAQWGAMGAAITTLLTDMVYFAAGLTIIMMIQRKKKNIPVAA